MRCYRVFAVLCSLMLIPPLSSQGSSALSQDDKIRILNSELDKLGLPLILALNSESLTRQLPDYARWRRDVINKTENADEIAHAIYPNLAERIFQATPSKVELIQQPSTVLLQQGSATIPAPNPDAFLVRYSVVTTWSQVVPSVADIHDQVKALDGASFDVSSNQRTICHVASPPRDGNPQKYKLLNCLMKVGAANRLGRFVGGLKTQFSYGQNPEVEQNINVIGTVAARNNFSISGEVDFDPKGVFLNGTDWNNIYEAAKIYGKLRSLDSEDVEAAFLQRVRERCDQSDAGTQALILTQGCLRKLSGLTLRQMAGAVLIPQVSASLKNQFDYVKQDGILVGSPFPTRSLYDVTLTVDPNRLFPSAKQRQDALQMLAAIAGRKKDASQSGKRSNGKVVEDASPKKLVVEVFMDLAAANEPSKLLDDEAWFNRFLAALRAVPQPKPAT